MDLRPFITAKSHLEKGIELIKNGYLFYQPYILDEELEVGEGYNFCEQYAQVEDVFDFNVYANGFDVGKRRLVTDKEAFRKCNAEYRALYDFLIEKFIGLSSKDIKLLNFAEIGCNTGLMLFNLARLGAKSCSGYDWNDMAPVFKWLNEILGTNVNFLQGTWDNLYHQFTTIDIPETDIMINTIYTNHQFSPLPFLAYICDRSRVGVLLWVLISAGDDCRLVYPSLAPHKILEIENLFPLNFNNGVAISKNLLKLSLSKLGFGKITEITPLGFGDKWNYFLHSFKMFYAERTSDIKSAFWERRAVI